MCPCGTMHVPDDSKIGNFIVGVLVGRYPFVSRFLHRDTGGAVFVGLVRVVGEGGVVWSLVAALAWGAWCLVSVFMLWVLVYPYFLFGVGLFVFFGVCFILRGILQ